MENKTLKIIREVCEFLDAEQYDYTVNEEGEILFSSKLNGEIESMNAVFRTDGQVLGLFGNYPLHIADNDKKSTEEMWKFISSFNRKSLYAHLNMEEGNLYIVGFEDCEEGAPSPQGIASMIRHIGIAYSDAYPELVHIMMDGKSADDAIHDIIYGRDADRK